MSRSHLWFWMAAPTGPTYWNEMSPVQRAKIVHFMHIFSFINNIIKMKLMSRRHRAMVYTINMHFKWIQLGEISIKQKQRRQEDENEWLKRLTSVSVVFPSSPASLLHLRPYDRLMRMLSCCSWRTRWWHRLQTQDRQAQWTNDKTPSARNAESRCSSPPETVVALVLHTIN